MQSYAGGNFWVNVPGKYRYRSFKGTVEAWELQETPPSTEPMIDASGDNYISNEIMYRSALVRMNQKPSLASGHIHVPPAHPPIDNDQGVRLIGVIDEIIERLARHVYLISLPESFEFLDTVTGTSRDLDIVLTNPKGTPPLSIASVEIDSQSPFTLVSPILPETIDPETSSTFVIRFSPSSTGNFESEIKFKETDGQVLAVTRVSGAGVSVLPTPTISSFTPNSGPPYTPIICQGTNYRNLVDVQVGGLSVSQFNVQSETQLLILGVSATGRIKIITEYGEIESSTDFTITGRGN